MGLTMIEEQAVTRGMALEYRRATKGLKGEILDSLVGLTEYNRSYAARALRQRSRDVVVGSGQIGDVSFTSITYVATVSAGGVFQADASAGLCVPQGGV